MAGVPSPAFSMVPPAIKMLPQPPEPLEPMSAASVPPFARIFPPVIETVSPVGLFWTSERPEPMPAP